MSEVFFRKYKNILGDANETIEAIQKYIKDNQPTKNVAFEAEEEPAASVNRILNSVANEEITDDIKKIIKNM